MKKENNKGDGQIKETTTLNDCDNRFSNMEGEEFQIVQS